MIRDWPDWRSMANLFSGSAISFELSSKPGQEGQVWWKVVGMKFGYQF